eukprot:TRINITY_DN8356_c0_g1_i1.p1 TRINITY_DN8356_c0_g1~~TRINITY_DN8356_c0_g1_i1.p1  ORF type:complete len:244 (+),score=46.09 TRINITY_DN8356_c0_g1_i1:164-895(+)
MFGGGGRDLLCLSERGNVGTSLSSLRAAISRCALSRGDIRALKAIGIDPTRPERSPVPRTGKGKGGSKQGKEARDEAAAAEEESSRSSGGEGGSDSDSEEWDRHVAAEGEPGGMRYMRNDRLECEQYLYEDKVEQIWDKGDASGLVFHTDAAHWEAAEGCFLAKTADAIDVQLDLSVPRRSKARKSGVLGDERVAFRRVFDDHQAESKKQRTEPRDQQPQQRSNPRLPGVARPAGRGKPIIPR